MSDRLIADFFVMGFYLVIFYIIFRYVDKKRHRSHSQWKSFGLVIGSVSLAIAICVVAMFLIDTLVDVPNNAVTLSLGVGTVAFVVIKAWRSSMSYIGQQNDQLT